MSSRGGGAVRLATRLREQTASAGAAGAEPTTGTPQRNRPCQCHRPSRGKASILPSKCALFLPGLPARHRPREPPGASPVLPDGAAAGFVCPAAPERSAAAPAAPSPFPRSGHRGADGVGELRESPQVVGRSSREQRGAIPPGQGISRSLIPPRSGGDARREREHPASQAFRFSIPKDPLCPIPDVPSSLQPISERSGLLAAGAQLPRFHNATSKSS
ncbi:hypothetical protein Nmel_006304 [Mimus melanotis]